MCSSQRSSFHSKAYFSLFFAVFTKALCELMEVMCGPLLQTLENRLVMNLNRTTKLEEEKESLQKELDTLKTELNSSS